MKKIKDGGQFIIIGGGPTGLGAASRLQELGVIHWTLFEKNSYAGGLSASFNQNGFVWDIGGHIYFSLYPRYNQLLNEVIPENDWRIHQRRSFINIGDRWVPYPFQNNLTFLPMDQRWDCIRGITHLYTKHIKTDDSNFLNLMKTHFGEGITNLFLQPYNEKLWAFPLEKLGTDWIKERVALLDLEQVLFNVINRKKDDSWGPNNTFSYPLRGGTGIIWRKLAQSLPVEKIKYNSSVKKISTRKRTITLSSGETRDYDFIISTMPLTELVRMSDQAGLNYYLKHLLHSHLVIIGLALKKPIPKKVRNFYWMYFPDPGCPFYRATILSNYSPNNAPQDCWSLLLEVSGSSDRPVQTKKLVDHCLSACLTAGLFRSASDVVDVWKFRTEYDYPTPPTKGRKIIVDRLINRFESYGIYSRGRFGTWKYEIGNMDHSYLQGLEVVDKFLFNQKEIIYKLNY
ncbi:MAG: FAD-dependent oxidoreductase [Thermodesulfobacteriota bacterium]|jgi:protoporphyrinogen oxidase